MTYNPHENKPRCALCDTPLDDASNSKEHVILNAIGGRKSVHNFICKQCNDKTGAEWDAKLAIQLQPLCTMLDIRRHRGENRPTPVETVRGEKYLLRPDGSLTIPKVVVSKTEIGNMIRVKIQAESKGRLKKELRKLKRKYPRPEIDEKIEQLDSEWPEKEYLQVPLRLLNFEGNLNGQSIIKSCLALAYEAGLHIDDCEHAKNYLLSDGEPCFGYYNETDVVTNRPEKVFFHCIFVSGDPTSRQVLAYAEYFGCLRIVACLSSNYDGDPFSRCYAIDPVTGQELDIDVHLNFASEDIAAIYAGKKVGGNELTMALSSLMETYMERSIRASITHAAEDTAKFAFAKSGVQPGDVLSEEQIWNIIRLTWQRFESHHLPYLFNRTLTPEDLRNIAIKEGWVQSDEAECD